MARIYGNRLVLREYQREDIENIRKWCNNPEITKNLSDIFLYPHSLKQSESFLQMMLDGSNPNMKGFVIAHKETGDYIGQIDLIGIDWKNRTSLIGIVIGNSENHCKGYGQEAIKILQKFAFEELNLHKLELEVHAYNEKAYNCYKKCGFVEEGRKRENFYINGKYNKSRTEKGAYRRSNIRQNG
jgi:RimJ/RimL family protein N-acetyltransferase